MKNMAKRIPCVVPHEALMEILLMEIHNRLAEIDEQYKMSRAPRFDWTVPDDGNTHIEFTFYDDGEVRYETTD